MSNVRFNLKEPNGSKPSQIRLVYRVNSEKLVYSLNLFVIPSHWDKQRHRVRNIVEAKDKVSINNLLNELDSLVNKYVDDCVIKGLPLSKAILRDYLDKRLNPDTNSELPFFVFIEKLIDEYITKINPTTGKTRATGTIRSLKGTVEVLKRFEKYNYRITFDNITLDWYYDFIKWCNSLNYSLNNTGKHIKNLKTFMNEAVEKGITNNIAFRGKRFIVLKEEADNIYLTIPELVRMYKLDLSQDPKLERARDLFLIGAFTGLRVSDFNHLKPESVIQRIGCKMLQVDTQKTGQRVLIPLHPIVSDILDKNNGVPPRAMPDQQINYAIKQIGRLADINERICIRKTKGGLSINSSKPKYENIKTHTARRSFCTNAYLSGVDKLSIMKISGHKSESSFMNYIKVTDQEHAVRMALHPFFKNVVG